MQTRHLSTFQIHTFSTLLLQMQPFVAGCASSIPLGLYAFFCGNISLATVVDLIKTRKTTDEKTINQMRAHYRANRVELHIPRQAHPKQALLEQAARASKRPLLPPLRTSPHCQRASLSSLLLLLPRNFLNQPQQGVKPPKDPHQKARSPQRRKALPPRWACQFVSQFVFEGVSHLALSFTLAGVLCPPRWACLPICLRPGFVFHLWLGCCVRLAGLVSQFVSHLALSFTLAGVGVSAVLSPNLSPSFLSCLSPWLGCCVLPTYLPTYLPTDLPTYLPIPLPTYLPTYLPT